MSARVTLRSLRRDRGLTLRAMGKLLGVKHPFVSEVEHGKRPLPLDRLDDWSRVLDFPPAALLAIMGVCLHCRGTGRATTAAPATERDGERTVADVEKDGRR